MIPTPEVTELAEKLAHHHVRVVFAESCTAGLVSALLAAVPGVSEFLCGSLVTYRAECKQRWLGISADLIDRYSTVGPNVSRQMSVAALQQTPTADYSGAITGHLGPDAPPAQDGRVYIAIAARRSGCIEVLQEADPQLIASDRIARQHEAARLVLRMLADVVGTARTM
jgi:PncC family amidohydrolase